MDTIGTRIARRRKELGMTQEDLAVKMGVSAQAVSKWENNVSYPDISLLPLLVKVLDITTDELLTGKTSKVQVLPENQRKSLDELTMRVYVVSAAGDKIKVNLPMSLVKICLEVGVNIAPNFVDSDIEALKNLDLGKIMELAERGLIGKLVEVESSDGDVIEVVVE